MIIRVDQTGAVRVDGHVVFTDFHVEAPGGFSVPDLAAMMGEGTRPDGDHLLGRELLRNGLLRPIQGLDRRGGHPPESPRRVPRLTDR